jgi:hypothetical protein
MPSAKASSSEEYKDNLPFYRCFIEGVLGIWVSTMDNPTLDAVTFFNFPHQMNAWPGLTWEISDRSKSIIFMDLTIRVLLLWLLLRLVLALLFYGSLQRLPTTA